MRFRLKVLLSALTLGMFFAMTSCGGGGDSGTSVDGISMNASGGSNLPWPDTFQSNDPDHVTLALKVVSYVDSGGKEVITPDQARRVVERTNEIYSRCNIHFRAEAFVPIAPANVGLAFNLSSMGELPSTRGQFDEPDRLVVINTGNWVHSSIGSANAWTTMPGSTPSGAVIEGLVAENSEIVAHELGHYLNLDHVSDAANLLNPIVYSTSTDLSSSQCQTMREAAMYFWTKALRV